MDDNLINRNPILSWRDLKDGEYFNANLQKINHNNVSLKKVFDKTLEQIKNLDFQNFSKEDLEQAITNIDQRFEKAYNKNCCLSRLCIDFRGILKVGIKSKYNKIQNKLLEEKINKQYDAIQEQAERGQRQREEMINIIIETCEMIREIENIENIENAVKNR